MLELLERKEGHREEVNFSTLTIEHVMPQMIDSDSDGTAWKGALGANWRQEHEKWLHTLGNLTLTGYNASLSNKSFESKRRLFVDSNVSLNAHFAGVAVWDASAIRQRAQNLGRALADIWSRPSEGRYVPRHANGDDLFEDAFEAPEAIQGRAPHVQGNLRVTIRWSMLGDQRPDLTIQESKAATTQAVFISKLIEWKPELAKRLQNIHVAQTYALSPDPKKDFWNSNANKLFGNKPVPGTTPVLYLYTNTSTDAKVQDINALAPRLGLPTGCFEAVKL